MLLFRPHRAVSGPLRTSRCLCLPCLGVMFPDGDLNSSKSAFAVKFNSVVWILTTGLQFVVGWWYRKSAVFYLPPTWMGPVTWWLSFPFAPAGERYLACGVTMKFSMRSNSRLCELRCMADGLPAGREDWRTSGGGICRYARLPPPQYLARRAHGMIHGVRLFGGTRFCRCRHWDGRSGAR